MDALATLDITSIAPDTLVAMATDEDSVQVRLSADGAWHRLATNGRRASTACGVSLIVTHGRLQSGLRVSEYTGPLCTHCFTPFELAESERIDGDRLARIPDSSNNDPGDKK